MHGDPAVEFDRRLVAVVARIKHDDFITEPDNGGNCREQCFGSTRRHRHFGIGINLALIEGFTFARNLLAKSWPAGGGRVLVLARVHRLGQGVTQRLWPVKIGKALTQVDSIVARRQLTHDREDRGSDLWQLGFNLHRNPLAHKEKRRVIGTRRGTR